MAVIRGKGGSGKRRFCRAIGISAILGTDLSASKKLLNTMTKNNDGKELADRESVGW